MASHTITSHTVNLKAVLVQGFHRTKCANTVTAMWTGRSLARKRASSTHTCSKSKEHVNEALTREKLF